MLSNIKNAVKTALQRHSILMPNVFGALLAFVLLLSVVSASVWISFRGVEISDEGYYLLWTSNPANYNAATSLFGYFFHPAYLWLEGNFVYLRAINIVSIIFLGFLLFFSINKYLNSSRRNSSIRKDLFSLSLFAFSSLLILKDWIPTPNYNTLNFQGFLLTVSTLMFLISQPKKIHFLSFLLGFFVATVFVTKPTSGILLFLSILIFIVFMNFQLKQILVFFLIGFFSLMAFFLFLLSLFELSLPFFFARGAELIQIFDSTYDFQNLLRFSNDFDLLSFLHVFLLIFGALALLEKGLFFYLRLTLGPGFLFIFLLMVVTNNIQISQQDLMPSNDPLIFYSFVATVIFVFFSICMKIRKLPNWNDLVLITFFLLLPFFFVFGTNADYGQAQIKASIFWAASIYLILFVTKRTNSKYNFQVTFLGVFIVLVVISTLSSSINNPYRQSKGLFEMNTLVEIGPSKVPIFASEQFSQSAIQINEIVVATNLTPGTTIIDLSGESPGIVFMLGGVSVSQPWLIGGYPGSNKFVEEVLKSTDCQILSSAWLLTAPNHWRAVSVDVLSNVGMTLDKNYKQVASWTAQGLGSTGEITEYFLYKPISALENSNPSCEKNE